VLKTESEKKEEEDDGTSTSDLVEKMAALLENK
jgi:hypothetical protein